MKKLITLEQHNSLFNHIDFNSMNKPRLNGIACPECEEELYDTTPKMVLLSIPPKLNIHCSKCTYTGYRYK